MDTMNDTALFLVTHGSSDRRSWLTLQSLVTLARSRSDLKISGGCLEGLELTLAQQLENFAKDVIAGGGSKITVVPMLLLAGVHVSEDIPAEVAIAQNNLHNNLQSELQNNLTFRITSHLGTHPQIPNLVWEQFNKHEDFSNMERQGRILVSHGSRRDVANQVIEDLADRCQAIAAYWGIEPKIETQIEKLLSQGVDKIYVLPYFLNEGGITEAIAKKLDAYRDRAQILRLPVPLSNEQIVDLLLNFD
jgi:sirohydrochlorin ferrochelatase